MFRTSKVQAINGNLPPVSMGNLPPVTMGIYHLSMGIYHHFPQSLNWCVSCEHPHESIGKIHLPSIRPMFHEKSCVSLPEGIPSPKNSKKFRKALKMGIYSTCPWESTSWTRRTSVSSPLEFCSNFRDFQRLGFASGECEMEKVR